MFLMDKNQTYTIDEFLLYIKEKDRAELYDVVTVFMAPASFEHESVVANLIREFGNVLKGSDCFMFGSNLQVIIPFKDEDKGKSDVVVLPDVSIVCDQNKLRNKRCYGAPDLIVEVLSPSTRRNDRLLKRNYYEKAGVKEYLIADYQNRYIEKYVHQHRLLKLEDIYSKENQFYVSTRFSDVLFSVNDIFSF